MKPPQWVRAATDPGEAEAAHLTDGDPVLRSLAVEATEPLEAEVEALVRQAPSGLPQAPSLRWLAAPALVALALAVGLVPWARRPDPAPSPVAAAPAPAPGFAASGEGHWTEAPDDAGTLVVQSDGVVRYRVEPVDTRERFRVRAGTLEVEVVGTVFDVGLREPDAWVHVIEGAVIVRDGPVHTLLAAGETWERTPPIAVVPAPAPPRPKPIRPKPIRPEPAPPVEAPSRPAVLGTLLKRVEAGERSEQLVGELESFAHADPASPLHAEALATALEVAAGLREPTVVIAGIDGFLAEHGSSPRALALTELRGDLSRNGLHDCASALPSYRTVAADTTGQRRARAEAWRGLCAAGLGQREEALEALRASLRLGVSGSLRDEVELALGELQ